MPIITIGTPTFNRARFIRRTLESACNQTLGGVEVLVSDDASTDETPEIIRDFGTRIRSHRNPANIGMWPNFALLTELATGEYFSWLQDDDLVHSDFARRAVEAFESNKDILMYTCSSIAGWSTDTFLHPQLYGPPVGLDWMQSRLRVLDGFLVVPMSFFVTFSMPPVTAYRTETIRRACRDIDPSDILFNERIIQSRAVVDGLIAVDPWPGGVFHKHENQGSLLSGSLDVPEYARQFAALVGKLAEVLEARPEKDWRPIFVDWIESISPHDRVAILKWYLPPGQYWSRFHPLSREIFSLFLDRLPDAERREHLEGTAISSPTNSSLKRFVRRLTPPLVWDALRGIKARPTSAGKS